MPAKRQTALPIVLLILATFIVMGRVCAGDFVHWDDPDMVQQNQGLNPPGWENVGRFWTKPFLGLYTPMAYTAWSGVAWIARSDATGKLDPIPFHLLNLLLHAGAGVFVFLILRELVDGTWAAWGGAMVFALHPIQVEAVAWVAGMNNVLCGALGLAAVWQYVLYAKKNGKGRLHYWIATALFAAALLSKPTAVVLPGVVGVVDFWVVGRKFRKVIWPVLGWAALAAPFAIAARMIQPAHGIAGPAVWARGVVALDTVGFYLRKVVLPIQLGIDYGRTPGWLLAHPWQAWLGAGCAAAAVGVCIAARSMRRLAAGLAVMTVGLLPVLGLTPFDFQYYSTVADRYMYLPMLGIGLMAAAVAARGPKAASGIFLGVVLAGLAVISFIQAGVWHDTQTLARQELAINPRSATSYKILAAWLAQQGHDDLAEPQYRMAISILSDQANADGAVWFDYGNLLGREGKYAQAAEEYRLALPRLARSKQAAAYNSLGVALAKLGDAPAARDAFRAALEIRPDYLDALDHLRGVGG